MEQIRKFLQGKGFALVLAACLLAAAAAGVWAVQTVRGELQKNLDGLRDPASSARTAPGIDEGPSGCSRLPSAMSITGRPKISFLFPSFFDPLYGRGH